MNKKLLIALGVVGVLLALVLLLGPALFEGPVRDGVVDAANDSLDADLALGDLSISLVRDFPSISVRLDDVSLTGRGEHEGTKLLTLETLDVAVNLSSAFGGAIAIERVALVKPVVRLVRFEEGAPNWEITNSEEPAAPSEPSGMPSLALDQVTIREGAVSYDDAQVGIGMTAEGLEFSGRADLDAALSRAEAVLVVDALGLTQKGRTLLDGSRFALDLSADVDQDAKLLTLAENRIELDSLALGASGTVTLPDEGLNVLDLTLAADTPSIASLISLVPGLAEGALEGMTTDGTLSLTGFAKGPVGGEALPAFGVDLTVVDGSYSHAALAEPLSDIQIDAHIDGPGPALDNVVVDLRAASAKLAGNPLSVTGRASKLMSDQLVDLDARGDIDLEQLGALVPRDHASALAGEVDLDVSWRGSVAKLTQAGYQAPKAKGTIVVQRASWAPEGAQVPLEIPRASMRVTPSTVRLEELAMRAGRTDVRGAGQLDNVLAWALLGEDLVGAVHTKSKVIDLDQLTAAFGPEPEAGGPDTPPVAPEGKAALRLPAGIDVGLNSTADKVVFRGIPMKDARVKARVADQVLRLEDVSVGMLDGRVGLKGLYDSGPIRPLVDLAVELSRIDITSAIDTFPVAEKLAPIARKAVGRVSTELSMDGTLDEAMSLVLDSLDGTGKLVAHSLRIEGSQAMTAISKGLKNARFENARLDGVTALFSVEKGRIDVKPFAMKLGPIDATFGGAHHFDQDIDYDMDLMLPAGEFSGKASAALSSLSRGTPFAGISPKLSDTVKVGVDITGTVTKPIVTLDLQSLAASAGDVLLGTAEQVLDKATEEVEKVVDQGLEVATAQAQAAKDQAYTAASNLKKQAYRAADEGKKQGYRAADRLVGEAGDPIAKLAAQAAATEAKRQADRAFSDAKKKADSAYRDALREADAEYDKAVASGSKTVRSAPSKARGKVKRKKKK